MKLMLPFDGSDDAMAAVVFTVNLIKSGLQADVLLANVQRPATLYERITARDSEALDQISEGAANHLLARAEMSLKAAGIAAALEHVNGEPAQELLEMAQRHKVELVVIGALGMEPIHADAIGPVVMSVLMRSSVPVLVVRDAEKPALGNA